MLLFYNSGRHVGIGLCIVLNVNSLPKYINTFGIRKSPLIYHYHIYLREVTVESHRVPKAEKLDDLV